jgi:integrase
MTNTSVVPANPTAISPDVRERVSRYVNASKAKNTKLAYGTAWAAFERYCDEHACQALPALSMTIAGYITHLADTGKSVSTISVALSAIGFYHDTIGTGAPNPVKTPEVKEAMAGIRRAKGVRPRKKAPATLDVIRDLLEILPSDDLRGARDRAILLIGFAGAFRRSELVAVQVEDLRFDATALTITIPRSKTDQEGAGLTKVIPVMDDASLCPVAALRLWMAYADVDSGPVFRAIDRWGHVHGQMDGREVARIVKRAAEKAGIDEHQLSGHSLRAGFITQAALNGVAIWEIKEQSGHKSDQVVGGYIRAAGRGARRAVEQVFKES